MKWINIDPYFEELIEQSNEVFKSLAAKLNIKNLKEIQDFGNEKELQKIVQNIDKNEIEELKKTYFTKFDILESISDYLHESWERDIGHVVIAFRDMNFTDSLPSIPLITNLIPFVSDWQYIYLFSHKCTVLRINKFTFQWKFIEPKFKDKESGNEISGIIDHRKESTLSYACGFDSAYLVANYNMSLKIIKHCQHQEWERVLDVCYPTGGNAIAADQLLNDKYVIMVNSKPSKNLKLTTFNVVSYGLGAYLVKTPKNISQVHSICVLEDYAFIIGLPTDSKVNKGQKIVKALQIDICNEEIINKFQIAYEEVKGLDDDWNINKFSKFRIDKHSLHLFHPLLNSESGSDRFLHYKIDLSAYLDKEEIIEIKLKSEGILEELNLKETKGLALYSILCSNFTLDGIEKTIEEFKLLNKLNGISIIVDEIRKQYEEFNMD